jgi:hypothetical protein
VTRCSTDRHSPFVDCPIFLCHQNIQGSGLTSFNLVPIFSFCALNLYGSLNMTFGLLLHSFIATNWGWSLILWPLSFHLWKTKFYQIKTRRGIGITHMEEALVPCEHGMEVIGHHDPISYGKLVFLLIY